MTESKKRYPLIVSGFTSCFSLGALVVCVTELVVGMLDAEVGSVVLSDDVELLLRIAGAGVPGTVVVE